LRLGANPSISNPGSGWCIRRDIYPPRSIDRHSRPPDVSAFTLAKRIRRAVDRLDPQGMPRSYRGVRRTPSAPCAAVQHGLLYWHAHSLIVEQGRADITCRRGSGMHSVPPDPGRTASPIYSGLICARHSRRCRPRSGSCQRIHQVDDVAGIARFHGRSYRLALALLGSAARRVRFRSGLQICPL
jgi:hypothetical protein